MRNIIFIQICGLLLLVGCQKGIEELPAGRPVHFSGVITRVSDDTWNNGDQIGVFMYAAGTTTALNTNVPYTTINGDGNFTSTTPIYIPEGEPNVDFIAYYPHLPTLGAMTYPVDVSNQSSLAAIDLIYSKSTTNVTLSSTPIAMTFEHKLSKITINPVAGTGFLPADFIGISAVLKGMPTKVDFDLNDGSPIASYAIDSITTYIADAGVSYQAIIIPQDSGTARQIIFLIGDQQYTYEIPNGTIFDKGHNYVYTMTINRTGVVLGSVTITDWSGKGNSTGVVVEKSTLIPELVLIPNGTFLMGSPEQTVPIVLEPNRQTNERQHWVKITKDFYIGKYEVTFDQYDAFCEATSRTKPLDSGYGRGTRPVIWVSWQDAVDYCSWLSSLTGRKWRLPTESEWEYACRAGTTTPFNFVIDLDPNSGLEMLSGLANFNTLWPYLAGVGESSSSTVGLGMTMPIGGFTPNRWGLYNMHGNVAEWVNDWYNTYPTGTTEQLPALDPKGPEIGIAVAPLADPHRVIRGGRWSARGQNCRSAYRYHDNMEGNFTGGANSRGFRVVMER